ncbi:unnamed protein product [Moneuplotes crassus]|uniref:Uncharacterized protein n=1 Tax=Euplotes crassus TaxID=5936 RepID=A0AAD1UFR3_EUPCR|nr:unnamed protein product [Moneuplotes crassus]
MSIRPKRRAARQQNYNEDDLYLEQEFIEPPPAKPQQMSHHTFMEPKSRIPQHKVPQVILKKEIVKPPTEEFSLKSFLSAKIPSKRVKTRLCGSKRSSIVDAESYTRILSSKRRDTQNKRKRKEDLKNIGQKLERERHFSQYISPDFCAPNSSQSLLDSSFASMKYQSHPDQNYERANSTRVAKDPVNTVKRTREENSKGADETELKSTVVSLYDRPQNKSPERNRLGIEPELIAPGSQNIESPGSMEINDSSNNSNDQDDECLIDQLWKKTEREYEEMIGDSFQDF